MIVHFVTALLYSIHNLVDDLIQPRALALELFHIFSAYMGIVQKCFLLILVEFLRDGHLHFHIEAAFPAALQMRHAFTGNPEPGTALCSCRNLEFYLLDQSFHLDGAS